MIMKDACTHSQTRIHIARINFAKRWQSPLELLVINVLHSVG